MTDQMILTDETLCVLFASLPFGRVAAELARARDDASGGHLTVAEVRQLVVRLETAASGSPVVTPQAQRAAVEQVRQAVERVDLKALEKAGGDVSIFVWDVQRDGPIPTLIQAG